MTTSKEAAQKGRLNELLETLPKVIGLVSPTYLFVRQFVPDVREEIVLGFFLLAFSLLTSISWLWPRGDYPLVERIRAQPWFFIFFFFWLILAGFWVDRVFLNKAPIIVEVIPQKRSLQIGEETIVFVVASDPDDRNEDLVFEWPSSAVGDFRVNEQDTSRATFTAHRLTEGCEESLKVMVRDGKGATDEAYIPISVRSD